MDIDLSQLTEAELVELNRRVVERIRALRMSRQQRQMAAFRIGDQVLFHPDPGREVVGTVVRMNQKTVTVVTAAGAHWRVAPTLLSKVEGATVDDARADEREGMQGEVIDLAKFLLPGGRGEA